jgi:FkbM family methyltransferase
MKDNDMDYLLEIEKIFNENLFSFSFDNINSKDIILYGAGSLGHMAIDLMAQKNLIPKYVIDRNAEGLLNNIRIIKPKPDQIDENDKRAAIFIICISSTSYNEIYYNLKKWRCKNIIHFYTWAYFVMPELMNNGWINSNITDIGKSNIRRVCEILSRDKTSLLFYLQFLWWKCRLKEIVYDECPVLSGKNYFNSPYFPLLTKNEIFIDGGACFGQTIALFITKVNNCYNTIYAFDPDVNNLKVSQAKYNDKRIVYSFNALGAENRQVQFRSNLGFASRIDKQGDKNVQMVTIDSLDIKPSVIKLHIEGSELSALQGAKKTIEKCRPILMVLADHHEDGLFKLPLFLAEFENYVIHFYLHDYCGNSAIFYAYPEERIND